MRFSMLICILTLCACSFSQSRFSAFTGGIEFGIGANKFVDFNELTNYPNLEREWYKYKLHHFPIQFGFFTDKYINGSEYIELAIVYASRSVSRILVNSYTLHSWKTVAKLSYKLRGRERIRDTWLQFSARYLPILFIS